VRQAAGEKPEAEKRVQIKPKRGSEAGRALRKLLTGNAQKGVPQRSNKTGPAEAIGQWRKVIGTSARALGFVKRSRDRYLTGESRVIKGQHTAITGSKDQELSL